MGPGHRHTAPLPLTRPRGEAAPVFAFRGFGAGGEYDPLSGEVPISSSPKMSRKLQGLNGTCRTVQLRSPPTESPPQEEFLGSCQGSGPEAIALSISVVQFPELVPFRYCREPLLPRAAPSCQLLRVAAVPGTPTQGMYKRQAFSQAEMPIMAAQHRAAEMRELEEMGESIRECGL